MIESTGDVKLSSTMRETLTDMGICHAMNAKPLADVYVSDPRTDELISLLDDGKTASRMTPYGIKVKLTKIIYSC